MKKLYFTILLCSIQIFGITVLSSAKEINKIVTIDPGHGTKNSRGGAEGEKEYAMVLSLILKEKLEKEGVTVYLTHTKTDRSEDLGKDYNEDNINRALFSNNKKSDLYFRVHFDAGNGRAGIYYPEKHPDPKVGEESKKASEIIFKNIMETVKSTKEKYSARVLTDGETLVGSQNNGLLTGSKYSERTTVLIEVLPLSKSALEWIADKNNQEMYAAAVKNGITEYLGK